MENSESNAVAVVIVAAYPSVRAGLHALLDDTVLVLDEATTGAALGDLLVGLRPDVVLLDTTGEESSAVTQTLGGLAGANRLSEVGLLVLGDRPDADLPMLAASDGLPGFGYLLRSDADAAQIVAGVRAVADGFVVLDRSLASLLAPVAPCPPQAEEFSGVVGRLPSTPALAGGRGLQNGRLSLDALTPRETEVLQQMAEGLANKQIGAKLGISLHTVKFHVAQILGKLNAISRTEAVTIGARRGYVLF